MVYQFTSYEDALSQMLQLAAKDAKYTGEIRLKPKEEYGIVLRQETTHILVETCNGQ